MSERIANQQKTCSQVKQKLDRIAAKGGERTEHDQDIRRRGGGHEHFERARLLRFLHGNEECVNAHQQEGVKTGSDHEEWKIAGAFRLEAGSHGSCEIVEGGQFRERASGSQNKAPTVAQCSEQVAA